LRRQQLVLEENACVNTASALVLKYSLFEINIFSEDKYSHGRAKMSSLLNKSIQHALDLMPIMILTIFFLLSDKLPLKIIPYLIKGSRQNRLI
jgi:hypothetical protein